MNNRQKAKHFKCLYEMGLAKKPRVTFQYIRPQHYKAQCVMMCEDSELAVKKLMQSIEPIVMDNMKIETSDFTNAKTYSVDIWMES